jgi:CRP-like cAMP-binding protein
MNIEETNLLEIFKGISFTQEEITILKSKFEIINLKKGAMLLNVDDLVNNQYFVSSGCLRTYYIASSGKEHTLQFAINDWWISDYTAFFSPTSARALMNIQCIQDAILYRISKKDMGDLYTALPKLEIFFRKKLEKAYAGFQQRILASLSQSAKQRYVSFLNSYPTIEQAVKNYHIASYLGITTESLSRIRKELATQ